MINMMVRQFEIDTEPTERLWELIKTVYGPSSGAIDRWSWEIGQHPHRDRICIWVADERGSIVGMTVRLPVQLITAGQTYDAEFAANTMVHPDFRRHGLVGLLYQKAIDSGRLQLSKGTVPAMNTGGFHRFAERSARVSAAERPWLSVAVRHCLNGVTARYRIGNMNVMSECTGRR